jgi:Xaa-Pro aminopeptidase
MISSRISKLSSVLNSSDLDAIALNAGPSLVYLTGLHFHLSERPIIVLFTAGNEPVIVLPELEMLKVSALPYAIKSFPYGENPGDWAAVFRKAVNSLNLDGKRIGVELRQMRLLEFRARIRRAQSEIPGCLPSGQQPADAEGCRGNWLNAQGCQSCPVCPGSNHSINQNWDDRK